jgi:hypothetical protein
MAQNEALGVLREGVDAVRAEEHHEPPQDLAEEREGHGRASWLNASDQFNKDL